MLYARVAPDFRFSTVTALGGHEFSKHEWRLVPEGKEQEAEDAPHLIVAEADDPEEIGQLKQAPPGGVEPEEPLLVDDDEEVEIPVSLFEATESAQQLALDEGIDLSEVTGSGAGGRILKSDVERYLEED